jgi:hypothetical protein
MRQIVTRILELIARDDAVKGCLLRWAVEEAEQVHEAELIDCDVSAGNARIQRTLFELGFLPAGYVPDVFHHGTWDVVKMIKLNVAWDLGSLELTDPAQEMYGVVAPLFSDRDAQRARKQLARGTAVLKGLSLLEVDFVERAGDEIILPPGSELPAGSLYIVLEGALEVDGRRLGPGESYGGSFLLRQSAAPAGGQSRKPAQASCRILTLCSDTCG